MKILPFIISACILCFCSLTAYSQIDILKKAKQKTEKKINKKIDKKLDEGLDKVFNEDTGEKKEVEKEQNQDENSDNDRDAGEVSSGESASEADPSLKWSKYDFIPGSEVIAEFDGHDVIYLMEASSTIVPYLKNAEQDYLPEEFTIEFDGWFEKGEYTSYYIWYYDMKKQDSRGMYGKHVRNYANGAMAESSKGKYPGVDYEFNNEKSYWRHIAISFNRRALKVYLDDARVINIPNMEIDPTGITLSIDGYGTAGVKGFNRFVKNFRVAKGAVKLYDKLLSEGKIIANGIRFEVGKSVIRPESMGIINEVIEMMEDHPELSFSIEGHTDSDGDEDFNLKLSEERADAVKQAIVKAGIESSRLETKGWGESDPVSDNDTPEGKANNRRVEFVKL
jgi:OOP family OmpA-OmpF porin